MIPGRGHLDGDLRACASRGTSCVEPKNLPQPQECRNVVLYVVDADLVVGQAAAETPDGEIGSLSFASFSRMPCPQEPRVQPQAAFRESRYARDGFAPLRLRLSSV